MRVCLLLLLLTALSGGLARAESPYASSADFATYAMKLRESALLKIEPQVFIPTTTARHTVSGRYPWKKNIMTTVFWVGETPTKNNPVPNTASSWDRYWMNTFGGFDDPDASRRRGYIPASFVPKGNPFYIALPYNDVTRGTTKPESKVVIPWFREAFQREGKTVCENRWVAIRVGTRICYAQWSDCGPFRTDHWQYVFGNEVPKPNLNQGAGLDVSPAVRDYLRIGGKAYTDWKFVDFRDVPPGPWSQYGENNDFVINARKNTQRVVSKKPAAPTVIAK